MNSFVYHFDCFKTPLTYRINGKRNFSTKVGCLMSIPLLTILLTLFFFNEIILKQDPAMTSFSIVEETSPMIYFNNSNVKFAFRISNSDEAIDQTYFDLLIENVMYNNTSQKIIVTEIKDTQPCDEHELNLYGLPNATCVADTNTLTTGGYWTDPFINYIRVSILPCTNGSKEGVICKSPDQIDKYFQNK